MRSLHNSRGGLQGSVSVSFFKSLTFAWWNTGLAPSATSRSTPADRVLACRVIAKLIKDVEADFIALGEMSDFDLGQMTELFHEFEFEVVSGIRKAGRARFDLCYAYNKRKVALLEFKDILDTRGNSTQRIAQKLSIQSNLDGAVITVLASHWPSRLFGEDADRSGYGFSLRRRVEELLEESEDSYIVMMGDYNDEPFDRSLSHHLMATRDIDLVRQKKHLLYNPFWGHFSKKTPDHRASGSYYYNGGDVTRWLTFDQIILSQAFLANRAWGLTILPNLILEPPELLELVMRPKTAFDHLPVYLRIEKVN